MTEAIIITIIICLTVIAVTFIGFAWNAVIKIETAKQNPMNKLFGGNNGDR